MTKVLIVDDSALMRKVIATMLTEGGFEVVTAHNGVQALEALRREQPDAITLDINMPEMDGLTCLARIMTERPTPVVMCSSLTEKGAAATLEATALGAVDFLHKPDGTVSRSLHLLQDKMVAKVRAAAQARLRRRTASRQRTVEASSAPPKATATSLEYIVLVGVSTGGPATLEDLLFSLPQSLPAAIVIAQHMPAGFTQALAERLNRITPWTVAEVNGKQELKPGHIYLGRGAADVILMQRGTRVEVTTVPADASRLWHPSVSRLVQSALDIVTPEHLIGVQLTGMGDDGAAEMTELKRLGGRTIAEAEETAVVFGMPRELILLDGATAVLPSHRIGREIGRWAAGTVSKSASRGERRWA